MPKCKTCILKETLRPRFHQISSVSVKIIGGGGGDRREEEEEEERGDERRREEEVGASSRGGKLGSEKAVGLFTLRFFAWLASFRSAGRTTR